MADVINFKLTQAGQVALWRSNNLGVDFELTHLEFGASSEFFEKEYDATKLGESKTITRITSGTRESDNTVKIVANVQNSESYDAYEIGVWCGEPEAEGSILFAIAVRDQDDPFMKMMKGVNLVFTYQMIFTTVDVDNVVINSDPNITLIYELIREHEKADDPHNNYLHKDKDNLIKGSNTFEQPIIGNLNGTADHSKTTDQLKTGREITLHGAVTANGEVFDGSKNISIEVLKINAEKLEGIVPTDNLSGSYNINAESATRLETPRKINGVEFDGTKDIEISSNIEGDEALLFMPTPYPKSSPPTNYLTMMGQYIGTAYPELRAIYGQYLPDMRAYSIRGLDNGRGIDTNRTILSTQQDDIKSHKHNIVLNQFAFGKDGVWQGIARWSSGDMRTNQNVVNPTEVIDYEGGSETRVKNIAFLYIVRAKVSVKAFKELKNVTVLEEVEGEFLSDKDQTITLYGYDHNGRFTESFQYFWAFGTGYASQSTQIKPPKHKVDEVAVFDGQEWHIKKNHFGKVSYSTDTQAIKIVDYYGDIEDGYTLLEPTSIYDTWTGEAWEDQRTEEEKRVDFQPLSMTRLRLSFLEHGQLDELDKLIHSCDIINRHFGIQLNSSENIHRTGDLAKFIESELFLSSEEMDVIWNDGLKMQF